MDFSSNVTARNSILVYTERLQGSEWDNPQTIDLAVTNFERNAKRKVIPIILFPPSFWIELINLGI